MTSAVPATSSQTSSSTKAKSSSPLAAWLKEPRNRGLALGGAVALIALVAWVVVSSGSRKEDFASRALDQARSAAESGNFPLAASEFQKVVTTFGGTRAAQEAVINLNQVRLINGQHELAVVNLQEFLKGSPDKEFVSPGYGLLGRALESAGRPAEAAEAYLKGAAAADTDYLKAELYMQAARSYVDAKQADKGIEAYRKVLKDFPDAAGKTEAEVRLAELTGGQM
jgi:outer membrane protein assembly factor BamD (BamD/ComL family)